MSQDAAFIYARTSHKDGWESEEKASYNVESLRDEYRRVLYSEKGLELLKSPNERSVESGDQETPEASHR